MSQKIDYKTELMWTVHNIVAHPLMSILWWVGCIIPPARRLGWKIHNVTTPAEGREAADTIADILGKYVEHTNFSPVTEDQVVTLKWPEKEQRQKAVSELTELSQEMGLYDDRV